MVVTVTDKDAWPLVKWLADVNGLRESQQVAGRQGVHTAWEGEATQFRRAVRRLRGATLSEGDRIAGVCRPCMMFRPALLGKTPQSACPSCGRDMVLQVVSCA